MYRHIEDFRNHWQEEVVDTLKVIDAKIGNGKFVAGDRPSIADCTLFAAIEFAEFAQAPVDGSCKNVHRWYEEFKQRPSASA